MKNQGNSITVQPVDASCTAVENKRMQVSNSSIPTIENQNKQAELLGHIFELLLASAEGEV